MTQLEYACKFTWGRKQSLLPKDCGPDQGFSTSFTCWSSQSSCGKSHPMRSCCDLSGVPDALVGGHEYSGLEHCP